MIYRIKKSFYTILIYVCLFIGSGQALDAQQLSYKSALSNDEYADAIQAGQMLIDSLRNSQNIPGIQVAVAVEGQRVWSEGFGYADMESRVPMENFTKMRIGSVSKTLTSAALGKLIANDKLNIDLPVRKYVPDFPKKKYPITTRQLAGHLAGIRHYKGEEMYSNKHYETIKAGLQIFMSDSLISKPGEEYNYSSYGWNLISAVIESASGQPYLVYMRKEVFKPIGMEETIADYSKSIIHHRTDFYILNNKKKIVNAPCVDNSYKWAGGGYLSTANDLLKFGNAMMRGRYLSQKIIDKLWKSQTTNSGKKTDYGMGWASGRDSDKRHWVGHSGGSVGGTTKFVVYPKQEVVVAIISNLSDVDYNNIQLTIATNFISDKP